MINTPKRRFTINIEIGADTWEGATKELQWLAHHIESHGTQCNSVSGSPYSGHIVDIKERPEMTNEKYFEAVAAYEKSRDTSSRGFTHD